MKQWQRDTITLEAERDASPYMHGEITMIFTDEKGTELKREAYWDGGHTYRISFFFPETGQWRGKIAAPSEPDLDGKEMCFDVEPSADGEAIYRHGFLKVSDDHHYLTYADGTPFFWLGDTHWDFAWMEDYETMFRVMADRRKEQGFNVYQTNLRSDIPFHGDEKYWTEDGLPNISFYQKELDRRMDYLADCGYVNAIGFAWFFSIVDHEEQYTQLARYFIARYGAMPLVWTLAGECGGYDKSRQDIYLSGWRKVMDVIEKYDCYHHLRTVHYTNERPFPSYFQDEPWHDFTLNQAGHGDYVIKASDYLSYLSHYGNKPFIEGEAFYEGVSTLEENGSRICTADMVRRAAYLSVFCGGCGYTYGANGIWDCVKEKGKKTNIFNPKGMTWKEGFALEGAEEMGIMKDFFLQQKFWETEPYALQTDDPDNPFGKKLPAVRVNCEKTHYLLYYPALLHHSGTIPVPAGIYEIRWFNPRQGTYTEPEEITSDGSCRLPDKPDRQDWCLIMNRK